MDLAVGLGLLGDVIGTLLVIAVLWPSLSCIVNYILNRKRIKIQNILWHYYTKASSVISPRRSGWVSDIAILNNMLVMAQNNLKPRTKKEDILYSKIFDRNIMCAFERDISNLHVEIARWFAAVGQYIGSELKEEKLLELIGPITKEEVELQRKTTFEPHCTEQCKGPKSKQ